MSIKNINLLDVLKKYWGYDSFREGQERVIQSILDGNDTIFLKKTGGGKSICFNIPAIILGGTTIIISPLKELQKDQVAKLEKLGISVTYLNSSLDTNESKERYENLMNGEYRMLFISPEKFNSENFLKDLAKIDIKGVVVDECDMMIEEDGSFRSDFLEIGNNVTKLGIFIAKERGEEYHRVPRHAFTATSNKEQTRQLAEMLRMGDEHDYKLFVGEIVGDNLNIENHYFNSTKEKDDSFLKTFRRINRELKKTGERCVIFCTSRKDVDEIEKWLNGYQAFNVVGIHAGKSDSKRNSAMKKFSNRKVNTIIGTSVLSRGIDFSDIRYILHYGLPGSFSSYVQEIGRGGRDGEDFYSLLFASGADARTRNFLCGFNQDKKNEFQKFRNFIESKDGCCIEKINEYFGRYLDNGKCGKCYLCKDKYDYMQVDLF